MSFEDFKNLTAGLQSIAIAVGLTVGAIWALFRFNAFKETEKARVELQKLQREIRERGIIKVRLNPQVIRSRDDRHIKIDLTIANTGNRTELLDWSTSTVKVALCQWNADGVLHFAGWQTLTLETSLGIPDTAVIHPNQISSHGYVTNRVADGIYFIEALIPGSRESIAEHDEFAGSDDETIALWSHHTYISVGEAAPAAVVPAGAPNDG